MNWWRRQGLVIDVGSPAHTQVVEKRFHVTILNSCLQALEQPPIRVEKPAAVRDEDMVPRFGG